LSGVAPNVWQMADCDNRRAVAGAHAGRAHTRTSVPSRPGNFANSFSAPAMAQDNESQTRTVTAGGAVSFSFTTSKCA